MKKHDFWRGKRLTPAQLLVHDIKLEDRSYRPSRLVIDEIPSSNLVPDDVIELLKSCSTLPDSEIWSGSTGFERNYINGLIDAYGWLNCLRVSKDAINSTKCRWIHVSSQFPEYIDGIFAGLSDWTKSSDEKIEELRRLGSAIRSNERWSKHGRFFSPLFSHLGERKCPSNEGSGGNKLHQKTPFLMSIPFLDWTLYLGPTPPLRFQIDEREGYASSRSNAHPLRTLLQYKYRLEETSDREKSQVYARHKPWNTDRDLDLKVRRFYGHYPSGLNVDELWILVVDDTHIVTFSSNQTWKARWPPLQLSSRIAEVSFRGLRKQQFVDADSITPYEALFHTIVCLNGAVGLVHRSFWTDLPLPLSERYAGQLGHLQFRLYRAPSTKLVLDLLQLQDELAIIEQITKSQIETIAKLETHIIQTQTTALGISPTSESTKILFSLGDHDGLVSRLKGELQDLTELRSNANELVTRTVQYVNIRQEDHGQAILVFTIVTVIFLPLSFLSSFFGMNVSDIRSMAKSQWVFWASAASLTVVVVAASTFLAFYGGKMNEKFIVWKDSHDFDYGKRIFSPSRRENQRTDRPRQRSQELRVLDAMHTDTGRSWDLGFAAS